MFALKETEVRLQNVNVRPELHGEEPVTAVDLKIEVKLANDQLAMLDPNLKRCFYTRDDDKPDLFDDDDSPHLTRRRSPKMPGPFKFEHELVGAAVKFTLGVSGKADIDLSPVDVNEFRIEPQEGGTVVFNFRIQGHPEEEQLGRLGMLAGHEVTLTVTPPAFEPEN